MRSKDAVDKNAPFITDVKKIVTTAVRMRDFCLLPYEEIRNAALQKTTDLTDKMYIVFSKNCVA